MENQTTSTSSPLKIFLVTGAAALAISAVGWFVFIKMKEIRNNIFSQSHTEITQSSHQVGNYEESVEQYEGLLKTAPSAVAAAQTKGGTLLEKQLTAGRTTKVGSARNLNRETFS